MYTRTMGAIGSRSRYWLGPLCVSVLVTTGVASAAAWARSGSPFASTAQPCPAAAQTTSVSGLSGKAGEFVLADASGSARSSQTRSAYRQVARDVLDRARAANAVYSLVTFTASSSSVRIRYAATFDPRTGDDVFDQAAKNRAYCQAAGALSQTFKPSRQLSTGSDPAGALAAVIDLARPLATRGAPIRVTLLTDGWIAPAPQGPNRVLFNLEAELKRGKTPQAIIRAHADQLLLTKANGIDLVVRGLDHRGNGELSNSVQAARLVAFYKACCKTLQAHNCDITSGF